MRALIAVAGSLILAGCVESNAETSAAQPPAAPFLDARTTPATIPAPLISVDPATLPDFALFRECASCPEMVVLPARTFRMGSPADEEGRSEDEDDAAGRFGNQVSISIQRFAIARFETKWSEWGACVLAGACDMAPIEELERGTSFRSDWAREGLSWGLAHRPAILIDWNDAGIFAAYLNNLNKTLNYRRPTEAEWEYAARGGTTTRYSFGDGEGQLGTYAWYSANSGGKTQPVGGKAANPFGLYDMHGNVWEWVEDCDRDNLSGQPANGAAYTTPGCSNRVFRGGSARNDPHFLRSAFRWRNTPSDRISVLGFRLARTL